MSAVLVKDGCFIPKVPMNGKKFTLLELQGFVDGYVEYVYLSNNKVLVVDEDGKVKGKPVNMVATGWLRTDGRDDYVCGPALLAEEWQV